MNAAEKLAKSIIANYDNQLRSNTIDLPAHVESLLQSLGLGGRAKPANEGRVKTGQRRMHSGH
jgi:hypothetical protein